MTLVRLCATALLASAIVVSASSWFGLGGQAFAKSKSSSAEDVTVVAKKRTKPRKLGEVYFLRGGVAGVFSRGLDNMGDRLTRRGVKVTVLPHSAWKRAAETIAANRAKKRLPVVLVGHSLGANSVIRMAEFLRTKKIRVDYMATFAATNPPPVPRNVRKATNYYFKENGWGVAVRPGRGFRGNLKNIDVSKDPEIGHFNIEKNAKLQRQVINNVLRFVGRRTSDLDDASEEKTSPTEG